MLHYSVLKNNNNNNNNIKESIIMDILHRTTYTNLSASEKESLLNDIANKHEGFTIKSFIEFEKYGQSTYTAIYEYEGCEFVFVPGDRVTLGWDDFSIGMNDETREDILESLEEYDITDLHGYIKECMSPVRTVEIPPMLVERKLNEIGYRPIDIDDPRWKDNNNFIKALDYIQSNPSSKGYIYNNSFKVSRINGELKVFLFDSFSYDEFIDTVLSTGFRLPTEDEWEYLCGGGLRTLFRWGDSFNYDMRLRHFEAEQLNKTEYDLKMPNQFGIEIAYDPYMQEVVMDSQYFIKGGDGGCLICGGMGKAVGYLPTATYFRDINCIDDPLGYKECIGGDYTFFRRLIRL